MILTDTHAHVYAQEFEIDQEECFKRSMEAGVSRIFVPNIDEHSLEAMTKICDRYSEHYFPMLGLHPCSVTDKFETQLQKIFQAFDRSRYWGIGEIGMDLYWDKSLFEAQKQAFIYQAQLAIKFQLPVSIHSRDATQELIDIIKFENFKALKGVFHCFTGDIHQARELVKMGFYLGIGGVLTYKNSSLPEVVKELGVDCLVLETDSPYLPPTPHRGKRNETSYLGLIANKLAEILEITTEEVAEITTRNSREIFAK